MAEHRRTNSFELGYALGKDKLTGEWEVLAKPVQTEYVDQPVDCEHGGMCNVKASEPDLTGQYELYCQDCWDAGVRIFKGLRRV